MKEEYPEYRTFLIPTEVTIDVKNCPPWACRDVSICLILFAKTCERSCLTDVPDECSIGEK